MQRAQKRVKGKSGFKNFLTQTLEDPLTQRYTVFCVQKERELNKMPLLSGDQSYAS